MGDRKMVYLRPLYSHKCSFCIGFTGCYHCALTALGPSCHKGCPLWAETDPRRGRHITVAAWGRARWERAISPRLAIQVLVMAPPSLMHRPTWKLHVEYPQGKSFALQVSNPEVCTFPSVKLGSTFTSWSNFWIYVNTTLITDLPVAHHPCPH